MKKEDPVITTKRLFLRQWRKGDLEPFAKLNADPRVREYFPGLMTSEESDELAHRLSQHIEQHSWGFWAACLIQTGEFIGFIGLGDVPFQAAFTPAVEIGWRLAFEHWGKGYATEGAKAALCYGFEKLHLQEIVALTVPTNLRSQAVMKKIGMHCDPKDNFDHPKLAEGHSLRRHVLYRIRADEWNKNQERDKQMIQEMSQKPLYEQVEKVSSNALTLQSYELGAQEYIDRTAAQVSDSFKDWIDATLACLAPNAEIIEIGSAFGRDANYIESFGFQVERTDATEAFVAFLQKEGYAARPFNILTDAFSKPYDLIFANAVFLHFNPQQFEKALEKIHAALKTDGILSFSVKKGEGEEWTDAKVGHPRYFCYWTREKIEPLLQKAGFEVVAIQEDERFLQIIAKRR